MSATKTVLPWNYNIVWIDRDLSRKPFENAGQENYLLCVYPDFSSEISLVISGIISLHDWFTLAAVAADKNCIDNTL